MPQKGNSVGNSPGGEEGGGAEGQKIDHRPQEEGQQDKNAQFALARRDGKEKEGGGDRRPKQNIQQGGQKGQADPVPQQAEEIVQQPHPCAQKGGGEEDRQLPRKTDVHQRNSRDKKPPRAPPSSS